MSDYEPDQLHGPDWIADPVDAPSYPPREVPLGTGQQCDFVPYHTERCREYRGLRWYRTRSGFRAYCWRHAVFEERRGAVPAPGGPLAGPRS